MYRVDLKIISPIFPRFFASGYLILIALMVVWPRYFFVSIGGIGLNPYTVGTLFFLFAAFLILWLSPSVRLAWVCALISRPGVPVLMAGFVFWQIFTALLGEQPDRSFDIALRDVLYISVHFFIATVFLLDLRIFESLPNVICAASFFVGVLGVWENLAQVNLIDNLGLLDYAKGDADQIAQLASEKVRDGFFRAQSVFSHPIVFGQHMAAFAPLAYVVFRHKNGFMRWIALATLIVTPLAINATGARSSYIVFFVAIIVFYFINSQIKPPGLFGPFLTTLALMTFLILFGVFFSDYFASLIGGRSYEEANSSAVRLDMLDMALDSIVHSPIMGYGAGMAAQKAGLIGISGMLTVDSIYISIMLDMGFVGIVLFLLIITSSVFGSNSSKVQGSSETKTLCAAYSAAIAAFAFGQISLSIVDNLTQLYIAVAALYCCRVRSF